MSTTLVFLLGCACGLPCSPHEKVATILMQVEAARAIANLASWRQEHISVIVSASASATLVRLLESSNKDVQV